MTGEVTSLLAGRRSGVLEERERVAVVNTFRGLDSQVTTVRYDDTKPTGFSVALDEIQDEEYGLITFGADIYPGSGIIDPNSALSMKAAAAHELAHYHRWLNKTELPAGFHRHLDEAMTSLEALLRYGRRDLSAQELDQLARDALHRLMLLADELQRAAEVA